MLHSQKFHYSFYLVYPIKIYLSLSPHPKEKKKKKIPVQELKFFDYFGAGICSFPFFQFKTRSVLEFSPPQKFLQNIHYIRNRNIRKKIIFLRKLSHTTASQVSTTLRIVLYRVLQHVQSSYYFVLKKITIPKLRPNLVQFANV